MRNTDSITIQLRASKSFLRTIEDITEKLGCSTSEFMRRACLEEARRDAALLQPVGA
jgi:hypothetical protein